MTNLDNMIIIHIKDLEISGDIDPTCETCIKIFYPNLRQGVKIYNIFAPRHKASNRCQSGKHPHCSCDICF